jgi:hypothetical protein
MRLQNDCSDVHGMRLLQQVLLKCGMIEMLSKDGRIKRAQILEPWDTVGEQVLVL